MGTLYIVATPIGNLQDITLRALDVLKKVETIACEDTRRTSLLLRHFKIEKKHLLSYYEQNEQLRIPQIMNALINGIDIALISDAGTPLVSDPGFRLVRTCVEVGIKVENIPGPSSVISSLVVSGLPTDKFTFAGYPPRKAGNRKTFFKNIKNSQDFLLSTVILFEAPHKLVKTLEEMKTVFGDIHIVLCRELTKIHEEVRRETISKSLLHYSITAPKGEFVILLHRGVQ